MMDGSKEGISGFFSAYFILFIFELYLYTHIYAYTVYFFNAYADTCTQITCTYTQGLTKVRKMIYLYISVGVLSELFSLSAIGWMEICPADTL